MKKTYKLMILPEYHVHTSFSPDSKMEPEEAVRAAIASGVTHLCFTEHMDLGHHMAMYDKTPDFVRMDETISVLREKYPEINVGKGIEAGYIPETAEQTAKVLAEQSFDYVLLSTHCVDGMDCGVPESKRGRTNLLHINDIWKRCMLPLRMKDLRHTMNVSVISAILQKVSIMRIIPSRMRCFRSCLIRY